MNFFHIITVDISLKTLYLQLCVNSLKNGYTEITMYLYGVATFDGTKS